MSDTKSQALTRRSDETGLMLPPPPPKRQKRPSTVLDEDVYSEGLSHIIARDFFPGLEEVRAQQEYLSALESENSDWKRDAGRRLTEAMTPGPQTRRRFGAGTRFSSAYSDGSQATPKGFVGDTPLRTPRMAIGDDSRSDRASQADFDLSLGAFQAKYISEDNESFNALLDKQNNRRAQKYAFFHDGNLATEAKRITNGAVGSVESGLDAESALVVTTLPVSSVQNTVALRPSQDLAQRSARVESFRDRQGPRNSFMFDPDGVEDQVETYVQRAEARSAAPPKAVQYSATRFADLSSDNTTTTIPASPSISAIDAAIAGRPRPTNSEPGYTGAETPRVNGYAFVDAEPTPSEMGVPVDEAEADAIEQAAAMRLLPRVDESGPNPFTLRGQSKREAILEKLVQRADQGRRKAGKASYFQPSNMASGRTPTPASSYTPILKRGGSMTPAAQRLAQSIKTPRLRGDIFGDRDVASQKWTPSRTTRAPSIRTPRDVG